MRRYRTDVIGSGEAATTSTIAAYDNGARTMLAVKGRFGVAGMRGADATGWEDRPGDIRIKPRGRAMFPGSPPWSRGTSP